MFFPGKYAEILFISFLCEAYEYAVGWRARWLLDPVANMLGYVLGDLIESRFKFNFYNRLKHVSMFQKMGCSFTLIGAGVAVLFANQPKFMKHDFY